MSERRESPWARWSKDPKALSHVTAEALRDAFVIYIERTVSNDRVVSIESVQHELPRDLGPQGRKGTKVRIVHRLLEDSYYVIDRDGRLVRIYPVDLVGNARSRRARRIGSEHEADPGTRPAIRSAADRAFERDLGPVVDEDGSVLDSLPDSERRIP